MEKRGGYARVTSVGEVQAKRFADRDVDTSSVVLKSCAVLTSAVTTGSRPNLGTECKHL